MKALLILLALFLGVGIATVSRAACDTTSAELNTSFFYSLVEVDNPDITDGSYPGDDVNDNLVTIGKKSVPGTIASVNSPLHCGSKWSGSAWVADTRYPTSGTYSESFVVHLSSNNSREPRFPRNLFFRAINPDPGSKWSSIERMVTGTCELQDDNGGTHNFYKVCSHL